MAIHIGTSGWSYDHWQGVLYPYGIPQRDRLAYYVGNFATVEVNSTFYHWPAASTFDGWSRRTPEGFRMTVKAPRGLTHGSRLYSPERWIGRIVNGLHHLAPKRGVLLVQTPPDMTHDYVRLEYFLQHMPNWIQVAVELRHESWHRDDIFALLERHNAAYCIMSGAHLPCILRATASFVYVRLHGPDKEWMYAGSYSDDDLRWWADRMQEWSHTGRDVWAYFNNDGEGNAVRNAWRLREFVGG